MNKQYTIYTHDDKEDLKLLKFLVMNDFNYSCKRVIE